MMYSIRRMRSRLGSLLRFVRDYQQFIDSPVGLFRYFPDKDAPVVRTYSQLPWGADIPVPPQHLWLGYGSCEKEYLESGRVDVEIMLKSLREHGWKYTNGCSILDLGCGAGRMMRHLLCWAQTSEIWGTEISAQHFRWLQGNLSSHLKFLLHLNVPPLPFTEGYFDLIYAGSVFTHVDDFAQAWILEIRRLLRPGGIAFLTFHDESSVQALLDPTSAWPLAKVVTRHSELKAIVERPELSRAIVIGHHSDSNVFYTRRFLQNAFGASMEILGVVPYAYGYQTAYIVRRVTTRYDRGQGGGF